MRIGTLLLSSGGRAWARSQGKLRALSKIRGRSRQVGFLVSRGEGLLQSRAREPGPEGAGPGGKEFESQVGVKEQHRAEAEECPTRRAGGRTGHGNDYPFDGVSPNVPLSIAERRSGKMERDREKAEAELGAGQQTAKRRRNGQGYEGMYQSASPMPIREFKTKFLDSCIHARRSTKDPPHNTHYPQFDLRRIQLSRVSSLSHRIFLSSGHNQHRAGPRQTRGQNFED